MIRETFENPENTWSIVELCELCGVSKSGYYRWKKITVPNIERRDREDEANFALIREAFQYRDIPKGQRQILMYLAHQGTPMSRHKIRRLMHKYNLVCPIRKRRYQRKVSSEYLKEHVKPNYVQRKFRAYGPRTILLTDITYLAYGKQKWAYLATVKDAYTNEILAYEISQSLVIDFVLRMVKQLIKHHEIDLMDKTLIHSDQGSHYTSVQFQDLVKENGLIQSMSRRGNCWDNAPQESFYGHMKDEIDLASCDDFKDVKKLIEEYMDYYNNERYQWNLDKLSPTQYYHFYTTGVYPLAGVLKTPVLPKVKTLEIDE